MATIRSSLPSRLRQLLSSENSIGPSIKIDSETAPKVKAFIDKVIQCPLQDIAIPLSGFQWEYGKGNFHHWRPLFLHFDTYFKTYLSNRKDLSLSDDILGDTTPFPKQAVLQILRVLQIILENCQNKSSFSGLEHFRFLLASTDPEVLIAALETLAAFAKIIPSKLHASGKLVGCGVVNSCLLSLAQGWGSKEEGLGLYSCVLANEKTQDEVLCLFPSDTQNDSGKTQNRLASTLYFEVHDASSKSQSDANVVEEFSSIKVINMPDVHLRKEDDLSLMKFCMEEHNVPSENRFALLTRIRFAHAIRLSRICRLYSKVCLLAFIVLVQSSDSHDELVSFFSNEPEYTNDLIRIVRSEEPISASIRTLAMNALGAQLAAYASSHERARILGSSMSFGGGNRMILLNVLQKAISSLRNSSDALSASFTEALLQFYLLHVLSSSTSGSVIRGSGMVPTFLPLLENSDPMHMHLVCLAVKTLQKLMDYSNAAVTLFKDMGGVELLAGRLQIEVERVINSSRADGESSMAAGESSRCNDDQIHTQKRLIRALLKALGSATYAPANSARAQNSQDVALPVTLTLIFGNVKKFGGDVYSSAVTLMSEIIHKDPTCYQSLHDVGLPNAFLSSVVAGVLPSSKAITCIPNGLGAVCLNSKGLEAVRETSSLRFLVDIFTDKKYIVALNEGIVPLANAVEELLRHVSSLRGTGVDFIIEIINRISALGEAKDIDSSGKPGSNGIEMEIDQNHPGVSCLVGSADSAVETVTNDQFIQLCIFHVMVLVHRAMENAETCRLFVEKSGIEALLKLLLRPTISQSSEGMSIALHSTMVFKAFTQHHSAPLARAFCSSLRDHLKKALAGFSNASESFLLDPKVSPDSGVFSPLFLVEFLLFLAASKDSRWVNALLTEFGSGSKDVLEDTGRIHREVMWQISLLEDANVEDEAPATSESQQPELAGDETDEQRFNSFRQLLDPLLRRRMSGWSFESQFFDLINLYRDLSRTSPQNRLAVDGVSDQITGPMPSDGPGSSRPKDADKRRSYYNSCCDMVKSLSIHITYLFQELGKAMLLPSRRRDDLLNVTSSAKSVASTFASITLDHINLKDRVSSSGSEAVVSTKCRYFGKVINFIDGILLDKPDLCNPVLLNCLYGYGVIHSVVTTFQATSQLHFAVNRTPASPMDTDEGIVRQDKMDDTDYSWIYGPLACYGKLMDHLVTSSLILSPFTKHLLTQPLGGGDMPFPRDPETFVKVLQSMVLKAVIPLWSHPQFSECNHEVIATVLSIMKHIYSGVEVKNVSSSSGRVSGPPPNETTISTIVEMGFSRPRAEEALRQVGSNSVELAMEWLFSHPEEVQEDDELARALAMSLGNSDSDAKEDGSSGDGPTIEEAAVHPPPVEDLLLTCKKLLQMKDSLAFPVRDLLVMICSQNDGQYRSNVVSFVIEQVKLCIDIGDSGNMNILSSFLHVLSLILNEDAMAREVASKCGLVKVVIDLLSVWNSCSYDREASQVPKWVTAAFIVIDRLAQVGQKLNADLSELLEKEETIDQNSSFMDEEKQNKLRELLGLSAEHLDLQEQMQLIEIACNCISKALPSETMHAVLQICSTLSRTHSVAVKFLDVGGLRSLLSLPTSSLFVGFDNVASTIIRHILEDPQTLQLAMESEIRHSVVMASNRQPTGRLTARNFLLNLTSVIQRDPVIFMQASRSVCQVEMVGDRPYIVLLKDRDKDKSKEKEKEKAEDKQQVNDVKTVLSHGSPLVPSSGLGKPPDASSKNVKAHKKPPPCFTTVMELLLDSVVSFVPPSKDEMQREQSSKDMDIDTTGLKGKGKAVASAAECDNSVKQESSAPMVRVVFILKLLTESLLMYASAVHVVLRRDAEISSFRGVPQRVPVGHFAGGIFHHILHMFLPYPKSSKKERKTDVDWRQKLASKAGQFLVASCVRSTEARKRIFTEISTVFNGFVESCKGFRAPVIEIQAFVDLLNDVLAARSPTGSYISAEASVTFIDVGLVRSLTRALHVFDLDNADSSKVATVVVKVLEVVTKEHVHAVELNAGKSESSAKPSDRNRRGSNIGIDVSQPLESMPQADGNFASAEPFMTVQSFGGSEAMTDDMEHDQDIDGGFAPPSEDDYMHDNSEDSRALENTLNSGGIRFEIQPDEQRNIDEDDDDDDDEEDDDDDMSGDGGDDADEDEDEEGDEHTGLEEDEMHHLPHPDTDQDDNDMEEDEFDEEIMEGEDEDDEDEEDGVILRLGEGMNGINVFDHIEVLGREHSLNSETLHVMPVEVFGSRRQGRTTSIYNLLGRGGDNIAPTLHPLLLEPSMSLQAGSARHAEASRDSHADRNAEAASSRLESVFRSLRNGRHGHRLNIWASDQHSGGSSGSSIPQGLEDLLVSNLRRPAPERPSDNGLTVEPQEKGEALQNTDSIPLEPVTQGDDGNGVERNVVSHPSTTSEATVNIGATPTGVSIMQGRDAPTQQNETSEMQIEQNDGVRDVEAVSQESSGSGATLGESLRSLDVEIGSADGHDETGERHLAGESRMRRANVPLGNSVSGSARDASLHSVSEVGENPSQDADQSGSAENQTQNPDASSGSIDPAFLEALPDELRAEVLSAQQGQATTQPQSTEPQSAGDIDPEFLAALPPDIREEVLAQQRAQRRNPSQELEGQPVEMDTVSIIATFPSDVREEVLLTSSDAILANLTPALVAEANMLRERFARRYNRSLFGMYPRNRRGELSRRGGEGLDGLGGIISRRSNGTKLVEADGSPLVGTDDLKAMIRLFRVVQPIYKGQLQRLLLNLCAHAETRISLVKIMMDLLMLDLSRPSSCLNTIEPPYRLYGCKSHVMYSRPQYFDGVPPLVSRRLLETLTYLARNHFHVARILLQFKLHLPSSIQEQQNTDTRGKAIMISEDVDSEQRGQLSLAMLLGLLKHPLYIRSISHLEQLLNLLDVIIDNAESKSIPSDRPPSTEQQVAAAQISSDAPMNTGSGSNASEADENSKTLSSASGLGQEAEIIQRDLPKAELRLLCSLLAREGLSDNAYALAANVLKKLVSIAPTHCQLFINELACSVQSLIKSAMDELHIFENVDKAFLAAASCDGAAILRVLQALSSLVASLNNKDKGQQFLTEQEHTAVIALVWDINAALEPLWQELSSSISKVEIYLDAQSEASHLSISKSKPSGAMPPLPAGTQTILPYIESFFVMCEKLHPGPSDLGNDLSMVTMSGNISDAEEVATSSQPRISAPAVKADEKHAAFVKFAERHRKLLNSFIRQNPGLLEKSFSLMLKVPRFVDFDNKRAYFRSKIKHQHDHHHSPLRISVRRAYILEDSYNQLRMRSAQDLKGRLTVHFQGEEGIDAGGLTREWYQLLSRVIFDKGALLFTTVGNESTFQPNPNSVYQTEHLSYFKFVGRVVGKALFDGQLLDVHFTRSFYKHILGVKVTYHDIEAIDPDYFKNLKWLLENDISDILDLTFSIDADEEKLILYERNEVTDYELIPNGRNIRVTEENKHQYVDLVAEHRLTTAIRPQINAFLEGFNELISRDLISIFNDKELELLISGLPDIDLDDLRVNTEYSGYSVASPVIQWFWDVVQGFSKEDKARLLQFVTGTSKVPLEGFSALQGISGSQKFQIHKAYGSPEHLPSAHTCFNQLDLPEYPSKEHLEERLLLAIHEANEGFGFG